ncbi:META domain-containing protein [Nioella aestuarii]|uniref:META domain-containing protein n=1 Tax=Nioella aestuarii TaxID=1662864 RepID=UPI003D7F5256
MLKPLSLLFFPLALAGCLRDETVTGYATGIWQLQHSQTAPITLDLTMRGEISGRGPCNSYSAAQTAPYPWFEPGTIASTRAACPDLATEQAYLAALSRMQLAEVSGPVLILSNDRGETLDFRLITPR